MIVFRLSKSRYSKDLSGKGAELSGGRWNSKGTPLVYTSDSRALCTTEIAVHTPLGNLPIDFCIITLEIPDSSIFSFPLNQLPDNWTEFPHLKSTQSIGDKFVVDAEALVLKVPSAVVQGDFNYLINPKHLQMAQVKILAVDVFSFYERLFVRQSNPG